MMKLVFDEAKLYNGLIKKKKTYKSCNDEFFDEKLKWITFLNEFQFDMNMK